MAEICKTGCCKSCPQRESCPGCAETGGKPFGGACVAAECIREKGPQALATLKKALIDELNGLGIPGLWLEDLNLLPGRYINLEYTLPNGGKVKLLRDENIYFGNQIEIPGIERCYGVAADEQYFLVCEYGGGAEPVVVF